MTVYCKQRYLHLRSSLNSAEHYKHKRISCGVTAELIRAAAGGIAAVVQSAAESIAITVGWTAEVIRAAANGIAKGAVAVIGWTAAVIKTVAQ